MQLDPLQILGIGAGLVLIGAGLWIQRARHDPQAGVPTQGLSNPSRLAVGLSMMVIGYHVAAYASPATMFQLKVPLERAWVLVVGVAVTVGASLYMDMRERARDGDGEGGQGEG